MDGLAPGGGTRVSVAVHDQSAPGALKAPAGASVVFSSPFVDLPRAFTVPAPVDEQARKRVCPTARCDSTISSITTWGPYQQLQAAAAAAQAAQHQQQHGAAPPPPLPVTGALPAAMPLGQALPPPLPLHPGGSAHAGSAAAVTAAAAAAAFGAALRSELSGAGSMSVSTMAPPAASGGFDTGSFTSARPALPPAAAAASGSVTSANGGADRRVSPFTANVGACAAALTPGELSYLQGFGGPPNAHALAIAALGPRNSAPAGLDAWARPEASGGSFSGISPALAGWQLHRGFSATSAQQMHQQGQQQLAAQQQQQHLAQQQRHQQAVAAAAHQAAAAAAAQQASAQQAAAKARRRVKAEPAASMSTDNGTAATAGALAPPAARRDGSVTSAPASTVSGAAAAAASTGAAAAAVAAALGGAPPGPAPATAAAPAAAMAPAAAAAAGGAGGAVLSRAISCKAYLKRLNITQPMAETLLPAFRLATAPRAGSCSAAAVQGGAGRHYEQLFKAEVTLVDEGERKWPITYEGVVCNMQRHLRLTSGWRDFVRHHSIKVNDTVVFERRGEDRSTLYVKVQHSEEGDDDDEDTPTAPLLPAANGGMPVLQPTQQAAAAAARPPAPARQRSGGKRKTVG